MLERIREGSQSTASKVILGAVILSFAVAGGGFLATNTNPAVAVVNGDDISQMALERAYQNERARMEEQLGDLFSELAANPDYLRSFRLSVLNRLISQRLLDQTADDLGLRVSDTQIRDEIRAMEAFQRDGNFDNERYLSVLRRAGIQPNDFRDQMRVDMVRQQLVRGLVESEFGLEREAARLSALQQQTRDIALVTIDPARFIDSVEVSDEQVRAYFESNQDRFMTDEQISLEYVDLTVDELMEDVDVDDAQVETWYQDHRNEYLQPERRRASHILIAIENDEAAARQQAEAVLARVKAGEDFAALAEEFSSDTFSARNGGDLNFFERGVMVPPFEEAAFALQVGEVSDVVQSQFGFHIIKLTEIEAEQVRPFDEVKEQVRTQLARQQAIGRFAELSQQLSDLSFELPDTLLDAAGAIDKEVVTSELFGRQTPPTELANPAVLKAAFSAQVLEDGMNSDLIEITPDHVMVVRLDSYEAARPQTLDEVSAQIRQLLSEQQAEAQAVQMGEALFAAWQESPEIGDWLAERELELETYQGLTRSSTDVSRVVLEKAFAMARQQGDTPSLAQVSLNGGVAVVRLRGVEDAKPESFAQPELAQLSDILRNQRGEADYQLLLDALREGANIKYKGLAAE